MVKSLAALTVKLKVSYISNNRPKRSAFYTGDYPFYTKRGASLVRREALAEPVRVISVKKTGKPVKEWGEVSVVTAIHLVYDGDEAKHTEVFLDWEDGTRYTLEGFHWTSESADGDRCECVCVTHDLKLIDMLRQMTDEYQDEYRNAKITYIPNKIAQEENIVIIVSYPHGKSKKVSVGHVNKEKTWNRDMTFTRYSYTAPTCPGSSGAPVFVMGYNGWYLHTHAGENGEENYSGEVYSFSSFFPSSKSAKTEKDKPRRK
ncbi:uncharacterized protein LOC131956463 [Physella acuta]|uniref:uncharacterized protein LOC131956463 n=1 Tax=Physella acuta TaxID=109671 RepID=UPI0027DE51E6|nr:uncharacterized protein LOC131956463 [Physella acuta]